MRDGGMVCAKCLNSASGIFSLANSGFSLSEKCFPGSFFQVVFNGRGCSQPAVTVQAGAEAWLHIAIDGAALAARKSAFQFPQCIGLLTVKYFQKIMK